MDNRLIISLTPGLAEAQARAERLANEEGQAMAVWEHVGLYGGVTGDIPARHTFRVMPLDDDPANVWAMVGIARPVEGTR